MSTYPDPMEPADSNHSLLSDRRSAHAFEYIEEGQFLQDLKLTVQVAESYFSTMKPDGDGSGVILVDADDVLLPDINNTGSPGQNRIKRVDDVENQARSLVLELHLKLQTHGWILIPFSRRHMKHYNATIASLSSVGFGGHSSLIMRSDDEVAMENWKFISERRVRLHNQGVHISSVISSQMDALTGPCLGQRNFKLAHPIHHRTEQPHNL
ncbi:Acid phosphatase protein [Dioscorea alata]|uniref:Acid phosphatase protein n=1 Tax=Dioscorea alata TaxID=55571 RepID=A0ACB7U9T8_DIOAL|nr:Acid phosphatase protein [Dioscorea alata]